MAAWKGYPSIHHGLGASAQTTRVWSQVSIYPMLVVTGWYMPPRRSRSSASTPSYIRGNVLAHRTGSIRTVLRRSEPWCHSVESQGARPHA